MTLISKYLSIGSRIVHIRNHDHLTQAKFAAAIGISRPALSAIESGQTKPSFPILFTIEYKFGYLVEWVLTGDGEMYKDPLSRAAIMPITGYETSDRVLKVWITRLIRIFEEGDAAKVDAIKASLRALDPQTKKYTEKDDCHTGKKAM